MKSFVLLSVNIVSLILVTRNIAGVTWKNCRKIEKATLDSRSYSIVADITSGMKANKREPEKNRNNRYTGDSNIVTQPSNNPAEQDLTLLSKRNVVLSLGHCDCTSSKSFHFNDFPNDSKRKHFSLRVELSPYIIPQSNQHRRKLLPVTKNVHIQNRETKQRHKKK